MFTRRFVSFPLRGGVSCAQLAGSRGVGSSMDWDAILAAVPNDLAAADGDAEAVAGPGPGVAAIIQRSLLQPRAGWASSPAL